MWGISPNGFNTFTFHYERFDTHRCNYNYIWGIRFTFHYERFDTQIIGDNARHFINLHFTMRDSIRKKQLIPMQSFTNLHFTMRDSIHCFYTGIFYNRNIFTFHYERFDTRHYHDSVQSNSLFTFHYERFDTPNLPASITPSVVFTFHYERFDTV